MNAPPKPFVCNQCHQSFYGKDNRTGNPTSRYPLLLKCGHTACLLCLKSSAKKHKFFCCPTCQLETPLPNGDDSVNELLPDLYILGILSLSTKAIFPTGFRDKSKIKLVPSGGESNHSSKITNSGQNGVTSTAFCEECSHPAKWWCKQCQTHYCGKCFDKFHKISKGLRKHTGVPIHALEYRSSAQRGCSEHDQRPLEFFCEDDDMLVCSTCAILGAHKGHSFISLMQKNEACLPELRVAIEDAKRTRARMKQSLKKIDDLRPTTVIDILPKEQEIRENFRLLHAALQLRESELLKQLHEYNQCNKTQLETIAEDLSTNIKEISAHLSDAELMLKNSLTAINGFSLIQQLRSADSLPCYIVPTDNKESSINVHLSQKLLQHINQSGSIEADILSRYIILPEDGLPSDYVKEPLLDDFIADTESSPSISESAQEINLTPSESSEEPKKFRFVTPKHSKILRHEHVKVVHIASPQSFFVQYSRDLEPFKTLLGNIQKWCNSPKNAKEIPNTITEGLMYLARYQDKIWYRAKANKVLMASRMDSTMNSIYGVPPTDNLVKCTPVQPNENDVPIEKSVISEEKLNPELSTEVCDNDVPSEETSTEEANERTLLNWADAKELETEESTVNVTPDQLVQVTFMDFGNTDVVPVEDIKAIPSKFMQHSFFAHEVSLWDVLPVGGDSKWSAEATNVFAKFVDKKKLLMSVIEEHSGVLFVDLNQPAHSEVANDTPVSIREALIFMEHAQYPNVGATREAERRVSQNKFFQSEPIQPGAKLNVMVTHIDSPVDFHVMLQGGLSKYFSGMIKELQERYAKDCEQLSVFAPRVGHPYVALNPADNDWYRAVVEEQTGGSNVRVKFVDFGHSIVIPYLNLRKIVNQFIKFPIQAIRCVLADVAPIQSQWDEKSTDLLKRETQGQNVQMVVHKCLSGDKHVVSLFKLGTETDTCLNGLLVREGLGRSTGPGSGLVEVQKPIQVPVHPIPKAKPHKKNKNKHSPPKPFSSQQLYSTPYELSSSLYEPPAPKVRTKTKLDVLRETPNQAAPAAVFSLQASLEEQLLTKSKDKLQKAKKKSRGLSVRIIRFENPGCFYTHKVEEEPQLKSLMKELLKYHESEETGHVDKKAGALVSALSPDDGNAYRGRITEVNSEKGTVKVNLLDFGLIVDVPQDNLKPLPALFGRDLAYATCCNLVGLIPAGGGKSWTRSACEFAQQKIAETQELFLVAKKNTSAAIVNSIPVDIQMKEVIIGGALEPSRTIYNSLAEALMNNGFALSEEKFNRRNTKTEEAIRPSTPLDWTGSQCESEVSESVYPELGPSDEAVGDVLENGILQSELDETAAAEEEALLTSSDLDIDWKPAELPTSASFMAYPTYVGYDGLIYLHNNTTAHAELERISDSLFQIFSNDRYQKPKKVIKVGQICVARFSVDKKWYRGKIHKVLSDSVEVVFMDYGNMELVSFEDIRLFATHLDVPLQCHECELHNVRPVSNNGQWPTPTLDYIHASIVDKLVLVTIKEPIMPGKRLKINLTLAGGDTITDLLVKAKLAHIFQPNLMLLSGAISNPYRDLPNPMLGCTFHVVVTHMIDPGLVCVQRPKTESPTDPVEVIVNQELDSFMDMISVLATISAKQPILRNPTVGMACLGQYSFDGDWYRCVVTDCDEDQATVVFIDYGNSESIPLNSKRLRKITPELLKVSAQAMTCRLHGIVSPEGEWTMAAHQAMTSLLFPAIDLGENIIPIMAQVMELGTPIEIILTQQGNSSQPIYQSLIDDGVLATRI